MEADRSKPRIPTARVLRAMAVMGLAQEVNVWHADHLYKHGTNAIVAFWLVAMLAFNLFHAFVNRNLKAVRRVGRTAKYFLELVAAEFHLMIGRSRPFAPS